MRFDPAGHKLIVRLLPEYLESLAALEDRLAEIGSQLDVAKPDGDDEDDASEDAEEALTEDEVRALKAEQRELRKQIRAQSAQLLAQLDAARAALTAAGCRRLVLDLLRADLAAQLDRSVAAHRRALVAAIENWWDKYRVTLRDIECQRDEATARFETFLRELEYAR